MKEKFAAIQREGRPGLILFLTAGFPDREATLELVPALVAAGADAIEIGVPFSDPLADGPTIQESSFRALEQGVSLADCLGMVRQLRAKTPDTPLILMSYYNPIYHYGLGRFAQEAQAAGVDGLIVVDLPPEEASPLTDQCRPRGIHIIPLLAPTSTDASIRAAASNATGFIYCISLTGVTGARDEVSHRGLDLVKRVRAHTALPLALGFGISRREQVVEAGQQAQAAVVGSALIRLMLESPRDQLVARTSRFVAELAGKPLPAPLPIKGGSRQ
ncbi:MAG: tryptophan synthase subunit alpha [Dehalococcoidia bacterium]|nr:tryptophan synthase subunit alpha [Dehalococcoidia bacterium]MSQ17404.1 tryptophan synthase subunit alpha [Dehalococcoidia bacterium]